MKCALPPKQISHLFLLTIGLISKPAIAQPPAIQWQKSYGGSEDDKSSTIVVTDDQGFLIAGTTYSTDGDITSNHGSEDALQIKTDSSGNIVWAKTPGGTLDDDIAACKTILGGNFISIGSSNSNNGDVSGNHGVYDFWVLKQDSDGNSIWSHCFGGGWMDFGNAVDKTNDGGYILGGISESIDGQVTGHHGTGDYLNYADYWIVKTDSLGNLSWQKCLGGKDWDEAHSIQQTVDGGYIVGGFTKSSNDGDVGDNHGGYDYWIVKLDATANIEWQKLFGGSLDDLLSSVQQTSDGGYIMTGTANSNDGDVTNNHGGSDIWVIKVDESGNMEWQKTIGGSENDASDQIVVEDNGNYLLSGFTFSFDGDIAGDHSSGDAWIGELDGVGNLLWQKCLGGSSYETNTFIQPISSGEFVATSSTGSTSNDVTFNHGNFDSWLVKLSGTDNNVYTLPTLILCDTLNWGVSLGGSLFDDGYAVSNTNDGGYMVVGSVVSNDGDVTGNHGGIDGWAAKLDSLGTVEWKKCFGGSNGDYFTFVKTTSNNGFIISGISTSNDGDVSGHHGNSDYTDVWVVKTDSSGNIEWQKSLGGKKDDYAASIDIAPDGGYIFAGYTRSNDGDVIGYHQASGNPADYWVVKIDSTGVIQWQDPLGGFEEDQAAQVISLTDGSVIVIGTAASDDGDVMDHIGLDDVWLVKINNDGSIHWTKSLGGSRNDQGYTVVPTTDGGFIVGAGVFSNNHDVLNAHSLASNAWLAKLDSLGNVEWRKCYGGYQPSVAMSAVAANEEKYAVAVWAGNSNLSDTVRDGDVDHYFGKGDFWIITIDEMGNLLGQQTMGGSEIDLPQGMVRHNDGQYTIVGTTYSNDGEVTGFHGGHDFWVVNWSCVPGVFTPIQNISVSEQYAFFFQNPFYESAKFAIPQFDRQDNYLLTLYDLFGEKVFQQEIISPNTTIKRNKLPDGIYFYNLKMNGNVIASGKLLVQ